MMMMLLKVIKRYRTSETCMLLTLVMLPTWAWKSTTTTTNHDDNDRQNRWTNRHTNAVHSIVRAAQAFCCFRYFKQTRSWGSRNSHCWNICFHRCHLVSHGWLWNCGENVYFEILLLDDSASDTSKTVHAIPSSQFIVNAHFCLNRPTFQLILVQLEAVHHIRQFYYYIVLLRNRIPWRNKKESVKMVWIQLFDLLLCTAWSRLIKYFNFLSSKNLPMMKKWMICVVISIAYLLASSIIIYRING